MPQRSGLETLKELLQDHGMHASALSRLLEAQSSLGAKILQGKRNLTVAYLRILTESFTVSAEVFLPVTSFQDEGGFGG